MLDAHDCVVTAEPPALCVVTPEPPVFQQEGKPRQVKIEGWCTCNAPAPRNTPKLLSSKRVTHNKPFKARLWPCLEPFSVQTSAKLVKVFPPRSQAEGAEQMSLVDTGGANVSEDTATFAPPVSLLARTGGVAKSTR